MPHLEFAGKPRVYAHHLSIPFRPLVPVLDLSVPPPHRDTPPTDDNLIIHGDNLDALKSLIPRYASRVNCIYIDPPYNTGNEGWIYNDNVNSPMIRKWIEKQQPVDEEDLERHDKWLCMMWPRLVLLRELLAETGTIFVSIDDNEVHHLRAIMDEIFGEEHFMASISWQHRHGRSNNARLFSNQREHILVYRRSAAVERIRVGREPDLDETYRNPDDDPRGAWSSVSYQNPATKEERPNLVYPILNPHTGREVNHPTHAWKYSRETHEEHIQEDRIWWGVDGDQEYPRLKVFLDDVQAKGIVPVDLLLADQGGTTDEGTRQLADLLPSALEKFNNPKPVRLIQRLLEIGLANAPDEPIVLDSFAGSGTTAQAVLELNNEGGALCQFILIECMDYADTITAERVRRSISGVPTAKDQHLRDGLGGTFTFCRLGEAITVEGMLTGDDLPSFNALAAYLHYTATGETLSVSSVQEPKEVEPFHVNVERDESYYLFYEPDLAFLADKEAVLSGPRARAIRDSKETARAIVWAADAWISQTELTPMGITFSQLPFQLPGE